MRRANNFYTVESIVDCSAVLLCGGLHQGNKAVMNYSLGSRENPPRRSPQLPVPSGVPPWFDRTTEFTQFIVPPHVLPFSHILAGCIPIDRMPALPLEWMDPTSQQLGPWTWAAYAYQLFAPRVHVRGRMALILLAAVLWAFLWFDRLSIV